ncbi:hypothetical protein EPN52_07335 [bacterium]|nr:MAG: hypothetical protein EPN52_07335 [bacterium]
MAALTATAVAPAMAQENPFRDVPTNSWAYQSIQKLYADGLIEGYPGGYFKGQRPLTRYEAAVLTERVVKKLEEELAQPAEAAKVNADDIAAVKKLVDEYGSDIKDLQKDVAGLKDAVAKNSATLKRQQFHLYYFMRAPGFYRENVSAYDPLGNGLSANTVITGLKPTNAAGTFTAPYSLQSNTSYGNLGPNNQQSGTYSHGTGYQTIRLIFSGALDEKTSYAIRLEDRNYFANQAQESTATALSKSYFYNQVFRLNYAYLTYKDPSGVFAKAGRFVEEGGPLGLAFSDYFQGAELGYSKHGASIWGAYSFNQTNGVAGNAAAGGYNQTMMAHADYDVTSKLNVGLNYSIDRGVAGANYWNPSVNPYAPGTNCTPGYCGAYVAGAYPVAVGSVDASYRFSPEFSLAAEALARLGNDPATGSRWKDNGAFWVAGTYGKTGGHEGNNYSDFGFVSSGFNSNGPHTEIVGTPDYQQFYFNNPNGYNIAYIGLHHWFSDYARVGVVYQHYGVKNGIDIPLGGGYYISKDSGDGLYLQTLVSF